jgi:hypothetical protein
MLDIPYPVGLNDFLTNIIVRAILEINKGQRNPIFEPTGVGFVVKNQYGS